MTKKRSSANGGEEVATDAASNGVVEDAAPAPPAAYEVQVNNGNEPGAALASLDELAAVVARLLIDAKQRSVVLRVTARMVQGENGAERVDGVK